MARGLAVAALLLSLACAVVDPPGTVQPGLPPAAGAAPTASPAERDLFERINVYRTSKGLQALGWSDVIAEQARRHSQEMASGDVARGHAGFDARLAAIRKRIRITAWAENVVGDRGVEDAVQRLLDSRTHRVNIEGDFDLTGVGAATGSDGLLYLTQIFVKSR